MPEEEVGVFQCFSAQYPFSFKITEGVHSADRLQSFCLAPQGCQAKNDGETKDGGTRCAHRGLLVVVSTGDALRAQINMNGCSCVGLAGDVVGV